MKRIVSTPICILVLGLCIAGQLRAQDWPAHHPKIKSFSVEQKDETLMYPSYLVDIPDEHTSVIPPWAWPFTPEKPAADTYLIFASSKVQGGNGGAVVLESTDLINFNPATARGYAEQVMGPPVDFTACDPTYNNEFDENYAGPGSVVQDPTLPPGNLIVIYEAENHCPAGIHHVPFYATVGFARSADNGRTWPAPANSEFGNADRHPIFKSPYPEPSDPLNLSTTSMGNGIPSAFVDVNDEGDAYLYVSYGNFVGSLHPQPTDGLIRVGRAKLGNVHDQFDGDDHGNGKDPSWNANQVPQLTFYKWYEGGFSQPGIAGFDSGVLPTTGCTGNQRMSSLTFNDDLRLYMMFFVCSPSRIDPITGDTYAAWYFATATSLDRQDWSMPQPILHSEYLISGPCNKGEGTGMAFDGFYPSFMSPDAAAGHTRLKGLAFFLNGCDTGQPRAFASRRFAITIDP